MKNIFKRFTNSILMTSIVFLIIGILLIVLPKESINVIGIIAAVGLIINGCVLVLIDIKAKNHYLPIDTFLEGIVSILLGILLVAYPSALAILLTIALGVYIITSSINVMKFSLSLKNVNSSKWLPLLMLSILDLILGILSICNPFAASLSYVTFVGIIILVHALLSIIDVLTLKNDVKNFEKLVKEKLTLKK